MAAERAPDHNPDIAADLHLNEAEQLVRRDVPRRTVDRRARETQIAESTIGAVRELQLWLRTMQAVQSISEHHQDGVDGRLRRLEAAAAADDVAIDDLRDLIEELRIDLDALLEVRNRRDT